MSQKKTALTLAITTAFAASLTAPVMAAENPFSAKSLNNGYQVAADDKKAEGKCGGDKKAEGKCGGDKKKDGKCGEGKCGGDKKKAEKKKDGKCGEGKCGGDKKKAEEKKVEEKK